MRAGPRMRSLHGPRDRSRREVAPVAVADADTDAVAVRCRLPLSLPLLLLLSPLLVLGAIALIAMGRGRWLLVLPAVCGAICAARGVAVEVENTREKVQIVVK